ncbi:MAG: sigma-70 family RNA polymerase sigma factor [Clostridia bacterium]|nr:sigma-70 family RNA polymerase sigma factor [Clostridia bacterium]NCD03222.1 sigma-70 family RNA polymerase sigma factor [Clostridia bacterium]
MRIYTDKEKLEQLFALYEKQMYGTAFRILQDTGQAEDAVQDAFLKIMPRLSQIKVPDSIETKRLMLRIIRSTAIDIYRKNRREWEHTIFDPEDIQKNQKSFMDENLSQIENRQMIQRALLALDQKYREVLELKCYFGLSHREIGLLLEITEDTVAKRYERAKKIALKMIGDDACA